MRLPASFSFIVRERCSRSHSTATRLALHGEPVRLAEGVSYGASLLWRICRVLHWNACIQKWCVRSDSTARLVRPAGTTTGECRTGRSVVRAVAGREEAGFSTNGAERARVDIWTFEMSTGITSRLTTDPAEENSPVWSPDSRTVVFASDRTGQFTVFQRTLGDREDVPVFESTEGNQWPDDWSRDGRFILINDRNAGILALPTTGDRKPIRLLRSATAVIDYARFSPDGRWVAYASTESGQAEDLRRLLPRVQGHQTGVGRWWQPASVAARRKGVVLHDGRRPAHGRRGQRHRFHAGDNSPQATVRDPHQSREHLVRNTYAVSGDGGRFLVLGPVQDSRSTSITVTLNWTSMLKQADERN